MTYDPSEKAQAKSKNRRERRAHDRRLKAMKALLDTAEGRSLMWFLLEEAKVFATTFTGNGWSAFLEGKRAFGLQILTLMLEAEPTSFAVAMNEANKRWAEQAPAPTSEEEDDNA